MGTVSDDTWSGLWSAPANTVFTKEFTAHLAICVVCAPPSRALGNLAVGMERHATSEATAGYELTKE